MGLGLAMISTGLGACGKAEAPAADAPAAATEQTAEAPADVAFEEAVEAVAAGGEGEGGISLAQAATDPVIYGSALAVTEAHIIAARDAYALGETDAAAEMFAHPVSEVLIELEDLFNARGVTLFDGLLLEASQAAMSGESAEQISARADAIIAALRAAATKAPESSRSPVSVRAAVAADQADRAATMYRIAREAGTYEPYLDGYGFHKAGLALFQEQEAEIAAANPAGAAALTEAFAELAKAYPDAGRQAELNADLSAMTVSASNAVLANSH
ncbi:putative lipoprotein [Hyphomonas hirschiana VP5]|uniref:Putative lipoprotein n=1 Tax=Hyphomonas hirschiana VP5 TaxID=1280951 RepID=A0A059FPQ3_9PROT|nr:putative lipoprotein [Hyphomonas hirschiana VP5]